MKKDLASSIGLAIIGTIIAYFLCNMLVKQTWPINDFSLKKVDASVSTELVDPDPELFNYKALNPTVEVYVGNCSEFNSADECIEEVEEDENTDNATNNENNPEENNEQGAE